MSIYEKTLYIQRLLYALDRIETTWRGDKYASDRMRASRAMADKEIDSVIDTLHDILEISGIFPKLKEV